jgi:hypothetical protein
LLQPVAIGAVVEEKRGRNSIDIALSLKKEMKPRVELPLPSYYQGKNIFHRFRLLADSHRNPRCRSGEPYLFRVKFKGVRFIYAAPQRNLTCSVENLRR